MKLKSLEKLINSLYSLPGITKKQAEKLAYNLLTNYKKEADNFIESYKFAKDIIKRCIECGNISEDKTCAICLNSLGDRKNVLIIVENPIDVFKFEESAVINGYYHVLHGLVDVVDESKIDKLNVKNLFQRSKKFSEIIIALSPNMEGIVTANYIKSIISNKKVTQLAQGIPLGAAMEYVDKFTLSAALKNRKEFK